MSLGSGLVRTVYPETVYHPGKGKDYLVKEASCGLASLKRCFPDLWNGAVTTEMLGTQAIGPTLRHAGPLPIDSSSKASVLKTIASKHRWRSSREC